MKLNFKGMKGITLIALVITIIVLLILAAVSIATLTGENGILTQAQNAKEKNERTEVIERAKIDILGEQAENTGNLTKKNFREILDKYFKNVPELLPEDILEKTYTTREAYGNHDIKVSEIWNGTFTYGGKTIAELYDGHNDPADTINYNENAMHIGDYVNYDAGNWEETKEIPSETSILSFGGYSKGQSRNTSASGSTSWKDADSGKIHGIGEYEGWRIWDISEDKKTMTLISAGCPEVFTFGIKNLIGNAEKIFLGDTDRAINEEYFSQARTWNEYLNTKQHAASTRSMDSNEFELWYRKYINPDVTNFLNYTLEKPNANKLISTFDNGFYYYIPGYDEEGYPNIDIIYCIFQEDVNYLCSYMSYQKASFGIRVLVTLDENVRFETNPQKIEENGFEYNKWVIE